MNGGVLGRIIRYCSDTDREVVLKARMANELLLAEGSRVNGNTIGSGCMAKFAGAFLVMGFRW
jgi:hypothetical protein